MNSDIIRLIDTIEGEEFIQSKDKDIMYNTFYSIHNLNLEKLKIEDGSSMKYLIDELNKSIENLYKAKNEIYRKSLEMNIDILRDYIEVILTTHLPDSILDTDVFKYYPEITDAQFNIKLFDKTEFKRTSLDLITKKIPDNKNFKLSKSQQFAKNFMSENTPYNGILLWHEVGVGKTCAGISIAENYRNKMFANDKKILILTPSETLQQNWRDEIFNIEKELHNKSSDNPGMVQCTGNTYTDVFSYLTEENKDIVKRKVKKFTEQFYQFWSYQKLAKNIRIALKHNSFGKLNQTKATIDYIKKEYSNRLIIMDEVHVTRETDESSTHKEAVKYIELIARYAENTKFVLLTATPMYNISSEIVWLLNILLLNDKRAPLRSKDIFTDDGIRLLDDSEFLINKGTISETPRERLIRASRGYISYVRGTNPNTFPIKIEPNDTEIYTPAPKFHVVAGEAVPSDQDQVYLPIENMKFYRNSMSMFQWIKIRNIILWAEERDDVEKNTGFSQKQARASNIVFPSSTKDSDQGEISDPGFDGCFKLKATSNKYIFKEPASPERFVNNKSFLHIDNIRVFSTKIYNIIESCIKNKGIGFIFSQYLKSGTTIMAMALEQNGFSRYKGDDKDDNLLEDTIDINDKFCARHNKYYRDLTSEEKKEFIPAKYILLDGSTPKPLLNKLIKECRGEGEHPNINGEHIKIVIGSRVTEQGLSLHRVREVHIMDPWFHLNQMDQAVGRAVRNYSHMKLPENMRNVTVFLHISSLPNVIPESDNIETPDERVYRLACNKRFHMAKIERILKKNAVDCKFNVLGNIYSSSFYKDIPDSDNPLTNRVIIDSRGKHRNINLYDTDGDKECDFESCEYNCYHDGVKDDKISLDRIYNSDTYLKEFAQYDIEYAEELIKELFVEEFAFKEKDIVETIREILPEITEDNIYIAIDNLVHNKKTVLDKFNRDGYIINRGEYYIFQPFSFENTSVPMLYRYIGNFHIPQEYRLKQLSDKETSVINIPIKASKTEERSGETDFLSDWNKLKLHLEETKDRDMMKINSMIVVKMLEKESHRKTQILEDLYKMFIINLLETGQIYSKTDHHSITDINFPVSSEFRMNILKIIIEKYIAKEKLDYYDSVLFNYYNDPNSIKIVLYQSDLTNNPVMKENDEIVGFRFIEFKESLYKETIYIYDNDSKQLIDQTSAYKSRSQSIQFQQKDLIENNNNIYGYPGTNADYPKKSDTPLVIFNRDPSITKTSVKTKKRGGVCGSVAGASNVKTDMPEFISSILEQSVDMYNTFVSYKDNPLGIASLDRDILSVPITDKTRLAKDKIKKIITESTYTKPDICIDISILLRYIDRYSILTKHNKRTYYSYEERLVQRKLLSKKK